MDDATSRSGGSDDDPDGADRRRRALVVLLTIAAAAVVVIGVLTAVRSGGDGGSAASTRSPVTASGSGSRSPSPSPTSAPTSAVRAGVTFGGALFGLSDAALARALDDVVDLHMRWIRIDLSWADLQPSSAGRFSWSDVDAVIDAARERGLSVLGLIGYTPPWAREAGCDSFVCPPRSTAAFARFAAAVVARYAPRGVVNFQIWNEPNLDLFWRRPDPAGYGRLLAATVTAMRGAADGTRLRILFGGLAYTGSVGVNGNGDIGAARFLREACGDRRCDVDAVGYDPYTYPSSPTVTTRPLNAWQYIAAPAAGRDTLRAAMASVGLRSAPVWVTGFGAPTRYPGSTDGRLVSEAQQGRILLDGLGLVRASKGTIGGYFVDTLRDSRAAGGRRSHFGVVASDGTRKPAFRALARALAR